MDWDIGKTSLACARCHKEFAEEEEILSALYDRPEGFERRDFCLLCRPQNGSDDSFSRWRTRMPSRNAPVRRFVDDDVMLDLFRRLDGHTEPAKCNFRYVVSLLLMRKRILKFVEFRRGEDGDRLVLRDRLTETDHVVQDPGLTEEQIRQVTQEVGQLLNTTF